MGICWDCYWGWPKPVADIYKKALDELDDWESPLHFGPAHVVWEDENFDCAEMCLKDFEKDSVEWIDAHIDEGDKDAGDRAMAIVKESLKSLAALPLNIRCVEPEDYDGEHPELYPPPDGVEMVRM